MVSPQIGFTMDKKYFNTESYRKYKFRYYLLSVVVLAALFLFVIIINQHIKLKKMNPIKIGDEIPAFSLPDQNGNLFDINSVAGHKKLVLYFYPKDESPGCTKQACSFRDQFDVFKEEEAVIIGISAQSPESHAEFAKKHRLTFTLLSDEGNKIRKLFGVPTSLFGLLPGRVTYIVDKNRKVVYIFNSQMQVEKHIDEALRILKQIQDK